MKAKLFPVILIILLFQKICLSQTWERTYGGSSNDEGSAIIQTTDSNFIIGGSTNSFGAGAFDFYLIKADANGDTIWTKTFGGIYNDKCRSVVQTYDGGYVACGESNSFSIDQNIYLIKTDQAGNLLWSKNIGDTNSQSPSAIIQTTDSGFCIVGSLNEISTGHSFVTLIRTDMNGDTLWEKTYGRGTLNIGYSLQQTPDNGFIVSGASYNMNTNFYELFLLKTDDLGDTLWTRIIAGNGHTYGQSIISVDSNYIVGGISDENFLAVSFDMNGNINWQNEYNKDGTDRCFSISHANDNGFLLAGYSNRFSLTDMLIIKIDSIGNELWSKKFGGQQYDEGSSIGSLAAGGFIATGFTTNLIDNSRDVYLVRTGCESFPVVQISVLDTFCMGDTIASTLFSNAVTGATYEWLFNDSVISGANSQSEIFHQTGFYELLLTDSNGCSNISNRAIINFPYPVFTTSPFEACAGDIIKMGDWGGPSSEYSFYDWDLGDGTLDTGLMVTHAYADTGWYNIIRKVRLSNGSCKAFNDSIHITTTAVPPVDFDLLVNAANSFYNQACIGDRVEFIPYAYTYWFVRPPAFDATSYLWDFGDGSTDTAQFPVHYYAQHGMFIISLTVTNHCGNTNTAIDSILIDSTIVPNADFDWVDGNGIFMDTVLACEMIVFNSVGGIDYHWDFGDGTIINSGSGSVSHSFAMAGNYNVKLTISNACGYTDSLTRQVVVTGTCTGIIQLSARDIKTIIYPNPFTVSATIRVSDMVKGNTASLFELTILNLQGIVVDIRKVSGPEIYLDRNGLADGLYFYKIRNAEGGMAFGKFIIE